MASLYHYTSLEALLGILDSGAIRLTDARYVNDSSELNYFLSELWKYLQKTTPPPEPGPDDNREHRYANSNSSFRDIFLKRLADLLADFEFLGVACFSIVPDDLSQWRGYTKVGQGVCIEFDYDLIKEWSKAANCDFVKCSYGDEIILEAKQDWYDQMYRDRFCDYPIAMAEFHYDKFVRQAVRFKDPKFEAEGEYRIISPLMDRFRHLQNRPYIHSDPLQLRYRIGKSTIVPYWNFDVTRPATKERVSGLVGSRWEGEGEVQWAITKIQVGPTSEPQLSKRAVVGALRSRGIVVDEGTVTNSEVPFREV